jgi:geranylgeranyl pyrophosphate synthase
MTRFERIREQHLGSVESCLSEYLADARRSSGAMCSEMTVYHLETGGKRLRALIPLMVFDALGNDARKAIPLGAAVEMIHNATLVHDDLQDGDEVRRNRPTVWKKYNEAQAINCGDAMFQYAFRLVTRLALDPASLVRLIDRMAQSTLAVVEGQAQEFVMKDERYPGVERYLGVIRGKTSGLFGLPIVGALEALGQPGELCSVVNAAAMDLGMLFQIQDDLLDVYGSKGRDRVATDVAEGKISILVAHVFEKAPEAERAELSAILKKPRAQTSDAEIRRAIEIFDRNDAKGMAVAKIRAIQKRVADDEALKRLPQIRELLVELGDTFLEPVNGIL